MANDLMSRKDVQDLGKAETVSYLLGREGLATDAALIF